MNHYDRIRGAQPYSLAANLHSNFRRRAADSERQLERSIAMPSEMTLSLRIWGESGQLRDKPTGMPISGDRV